MRFTIAAAGISRKKRIKKRRCVSHRREGVGWPSDATPPQILADVAVKRQARALTKVQRTPSGLSVSTRAEEPNALARRAVYCARGPILGAAPRVMGPLGIAGQRRLVSTGPAVGVDD